MCDHDPYESYKSKYSKVSHLDILAQLQHVDVQLYLPDDILIKVDKASMFNSLETRAPLLDHHLAEYVASLHPSLRIHNGKLKYLLKQVAKDLLPAEILARPKQGFGVPIKHWFRNDLTTYASELLDSPRAQQRGIFNAQFIRKLLKEHARTSLVNHSSAIWTLICLELWFQIYMDSPARNPEQSSQIQITSSR